MDNNPNFGIAPILHMETKPNIIMVGHVGHSHILPIIHSMESKGFNVTQKEINEVKKINDLSLPTFTITNNRLLDEPMIVGGEKKFICKGIHQYKPFETKDEKGNGTIIKKEWICQCGRKL